MNWKGTEKWDFVSFFSFPANGINTAGNFTISIHSFNIVYWTVKFTTLKWEADAVAFYYFIPDNFEGKLYRKNHKVMFPLGNDIKNIILTLSRRKVFLLYLDNAKVNNKQQTFSFPTEMITTDNCYFEECQDYFRKGEYLCLNCLVDWIWFDFGLKKIIKRRVACIDFVL